MWRRKRQEKLRHKKVTAKETERVPEREKEWNKEQ